MYTEEILDMADMSRLNMASFCALVKPFGKSCVRCWHWPLGLGVHIWPAAWSMSIFSLLSHIACWRIACCLPPWLWWGLLSAYRYCFLPFVYYIICLIVNHCRTNNQCAIKDIWTSKHAMVCTKVRRACNILCMLWCYISQICLLIKYCGAFISVNI